ncbi:MAG TPA: hypothetical protein VF765_15455 [Polyangiaceae bacterium]
MRSTLPFAPFALRELAEHWERQMARAAAPTEREELRSHLLQVYVQIVHNDFDPFVRRATGERLLAMLEEGPSEPAILEQLADVAAADEDAMLERRTLALLAARTEDTGARPRIVERLGDVLDQLGERDAAVDAWKSAAALLEETPFEREHTRRLYERTLDARPDDGEAAEKLTPLYAQDREWPKVAEMLGVVVRADAQRAAALLLLVAPGAAEAAAHAELASMVDEVLALLPSGSESARDLLRVKARALAASPGRHAEASETYRAILQAFGGDDDLREYEAHVASTDDAMARHDEHRWLYQWRAANDAQPCEPLLAWAKEEEEHGEIELAIGILRRALAESPGLEAALDPLCRLSLRTGDFAGALDALEALAAAARRDDRPHLGSYVGPLLQTGAANVLAGALDTSDEIALFERVVRVGRVLDQLDAVVLWYGRALRERVTDAALAEAIGTRIAALETECALDPSFFVETLDRVLELVPGARWALDRVKLALAAQARWDDLFRRIDRALEAVGRTPARAELLEEAAFAARDVANDVGRATTYLRALCDERPDDAAAAAALEHLYERQRRKVVLAEFLSGRAERSQGAARLELQRRVAALRLELDDIEDASAVVDAMLDGGADVAGVCDLLEQLARHPGQERAVDRLRAHYETVARLDDCIRLVEASLDASRDEARSVALARDLVRLRVSVAAGKASAFVKASARLQLDAAKRPALAATMHRALLRRAIAASKGAATDAEFHDALDGASRTLDAWTTLLLDGGDVAGACRVLRRGSRLPFERDRQRQLQGRAAELAMDRLGDATRSIRLLEEIFRGDGGDAVARGLVDRFARLLRDAGREERLAALWEQQAANRAKNGDGVAEGTYRRRAGEAWERAGSVGRAMAAYDRAAELGVEEAYEALARIHADHARWSEAVGVLEWLCMHARAADVARHALRLAEAYLHVDRRDRARTCLEEALAAAPDAADAHADALRRMLAALYRREGARKKLADMLAAIARTSPNDAAVRLELADLLEGLGQWARAAQSLSERIALYGDQRTPERAHLHHRLAGILVRAGDRAGAFAQLRIASKMLPRHAAILHDLARAAVDLGEVDVAEQAYRALLIAMRRPAEAPVAASPAQILLELARLALRRGHASRAANVADSALQSALDAGEDPRPFERALREMDRHDLLVSTLMHHVERSSDIAARCAALRDLADVWRSDLHREPEFRGLLRRSARILRADLERERVADGATWAALWSVHAALGEEAILLEAGDRIVPVLQDAIGRIDAAPDRARLRVALAEMVAARANGADEAERLLSTALGETDDAETAERIAHQLGVLGSPRVADALELCMTLDPRAVRALAPRLAALRDAQGDAAGVVRALETLFANDPERGAAPKDLPLLRRLVAAYEDLGTDPETIGLERMASLAVADSAWDRAASMYARMVRASADPRQAAPRLLDACERAGRPADAREPLEEARRRAPGCAEIDDALERVYELTHEWASLAVLLAARAERTSEVPAKVALLLRAATVLVERAGEPSAAMPWVDQARAAQPENLEAVLLWARLQKAAGRSREALGALEDAVRRARTKRSPMLAAVYLEIGEAHLASDDLVEGFDALKAGFAIDWHSGRLALLLGLVALDLGDEKIAERALLAVAMAAPRREGSTAGATAAEKATAYEQLAALARAQGDLVKERRWASRAAEEEPPGRSDVRALLGKSDATPAIVRVANR